MKDNIGDRMKNFYENRSKTKLLRRSYSIIRIDGKAFHTYTKGLSKPFDEGLINDMNLTAIELCEKIQGAKFAYVQSDEISILITDFEKIETSMWYDGEVQKITSVSSSIATAKFNQLRTLRILETATPDSYNKIIPKLKTMKMAEFDSRVFQVPYIDEVLNYFIWRQQDAVRNSISSVAQSLYSHKELNGKKTNDMQEMIFQKGINWNNYTVREKRGIIIRKFDDKFNIDNETPIFTKNKEYMSNLFIPNV